MTFATSETSEELGRPYETYLFEYGFDYQSHYAYTNAVDPIAVGSVTFAPVPIKREAYKTTAKVEKSDLTIRVPVDLDISRLYLDYPPPQEVIVTIRQNHYGSGDDLGMVVFMGRVTSVSKEKTEAILTCTNSMISLKRQGLRRNWQRGCPLMLYGVSCRADMDRATVEVEIADVIDRNLVLPANWWGPYPKEKFSGGMIRWMSEYGREWRTIRSVADNTVVFVGPLRGIEPGMKVDFILGCQHNRTDCKDVHDNIKNYGGQPWIPFENPTQYANFW